MIRKNARSKRGWRLSAWALGWIAITAQLLLGGCAAVPPVTPSVAAATSTTLPVETPSGRDQTPAVINSSGSTPAPVTPISPTAELTRPAAVTSEAFSVCSPLEGVALAELRQPDLLKNPFQAPRPGMDDGHHGADFAYWTRGERTSMQGLPVYSVLPGKVAGVIDNRLPYGNAVIVETPLRGLPEAFITSLALPSPQPTVAAAPSLYCPPDAHHYGNPKEQSVYLLYAHLNQTPTLAVGDVVGCGSPIGEVGTTGKSVNYHLHLEARAGPSGSVFPSFAHYDTAATEEEMSTYCTWRVSGLFQMFDPLALIPTASPEPSLQP